MKKVKNLSILFLMVLAVTGCGRDDGRNPAQNGSSVDKVLNEQVSASDEKSEGSDIEKADTENSAVKEDADKGNGAAEEDADKESGAAKEDADKENSTAKENTGTDGQSEAAKEEAAENTDGVDYDLTSMSSDMVYATVYQMMVDPEAYVGKTIRMGGLYSATYYEKTKQYYHYCIIQDATACCAQGIEFVWGDGSHAYPDEYPENNTEIVVQGVFETYQEDGDDNLYCHLKDAALEIKNQV